MADRPIVMVSNRGPLSFSLTDGELVAKRGAGGLVSGIGPLLRGTGQPWIAAAISDGDRLAAEQGLVDAEGFAVRLLALDPDDYRMSYDVVANAAMWFMHHGLFELARRPRFDATFIEAWDAYRRVNRAFAEATADSAPEGSIVAVQDYHLALMGTMLRELRPDVTAVHFSHTPFSGPDGLRVLPRPMAQELLNGMADHHASGFHTERWADGFRASCRDLIGRDPNTFVSPLAPDPQDLAGVASGVASQEAHEILSEQVGDRQLIGRADRIELSKNIVRGFLAYELFLEEHPQWHDRVIFGASIYPSREGLAEYLAYRQEIESVCARINRRFATDTWEPILLDTCLLYTSPSPRDATLSRMPSSA